MQAASKKRKQMNETMSGSAIKQPKIPADPLSSRSVHDNVHKYAGSISAEHGLGALKRDEIKRYKSETELAMMAAIKQALDPLNLMNPGKVI